MHWVCRHFFRPISILFQADLISFRKPLSILMFMRHAVRFFHSIFFRPITYLLLPNSLQFYCLNSIRPRVLFPSDFSAPPPSSYQTHCLISISSCAISIKYTPSIFFFQENHDFYQTCCLISICPTAIFLLTAPLLLQFPLDCLSKFG